MLEKELKELRQVILNVDSKINWDIIRSKMVSRIWEDSQASDGSEIKSKTSLKDSGTLKKSFDVTSGNIIVEDYAKYLEDKYGSIFSLSKEEFEELGSQIAKILKT